MRRHRNVRGQWVRSWRIRIGVPGLVPWSVSSCVEPRRNEEERIEPVSRARMRCGFGVNKRRSNSTDLPRFETSCSRFVAYRVADCAETLVVEVLDFAGVGGAPGQD